MILILLACSQAPTAGVDDSAEPAVARWTGTAQVRVEDEDGVPVELAWVMQGGAPEEDWVATDAAGEATVEVSDDGVTDRYLLAGKEGWTSGGENLRETEPPPDPVVIVMKRLPDEDNPSYAGQPGGDSSSHSAAECGHCHYTIADGWAGSRHRDAARNPRTWDLYLGAATEAADCEALGGWLASGQAADEPGATVERCYLGEGVLPFLNAGCGGPDETPCDHPDQRASLARLGDCGDCHSPAVEGAVPGAVDYAGASGIGFDEGVACDFCHKIASVTPGGAPGLNGAINLLRPSQPTAVTGQVHDPITFGPYPDVIVAIMKGSYAPQFRESGWCSSCHEYARDGLPIHETWSEMEAGPYADSGISCQSCHMPVVDEESSTYDIMADLGMNPSVDQGWLRASGEVRHHHFAAELGAPGLDLDLATEGGTLLATVTVTNGAAGHALPTGEPLRQWILLVEATDAAGEPLAPAGGRAVPDLGGYLLTGRVGDDLTVDGRQLTFDSPVPGAGSLVRFARPTGEWDDYAGPGTATFSDPGLSAEAKGLPIFEVLGEVAVEAREGAALTLAAPPPELLAGDVAFLVDDARWAGAPGWLFAKVLVDDTGARGVAHYRATALASDNRLAPGASSATEHRFVLPAEGSVAVTARLLHRRYGSSVATVYGWDPADTTVAEATTSISTE